MPGGVRPPTSLDGVVQRMSLGLDAAIGGLAVERSRGANRHQSIIGQDFTPSFLMANLCGISSIPAARRPATWARDEMNTVAAVDAFEKNAWLARSVLDCIRARH